MEWPITITNYTWVEKTRCKIHTHTKGYKNEEMLRYANASRKVVRLSGLLQGMNICQK